MPGDWSTHHHYTHNLTVVSAPIVDSYAKLVALRWVMMRVMSSNEGTSLPVRERL